MSLQPADKKALTILAAVAAVMVIVIAVAVSWRKGWIAMAGQRIREARSADAGDGSSSIGPADGTDEEHRE